MTQASPCLTRRKAQTGGVVRVTEAPTPTYDAPVATCDARFRWTLPVVQPTSVDVYVVVNVIADADADVKRNDVVGRDAFAREVLRGPGLRRRS
jgi:hypothetical protein